MKDKFQRDLAVGDRITIPATVKASLDGTLVATLLTGGAEVAVAPASVLRCLEGDNNGLDDHILEDIETKARAHHDATVASYEDARKQLKDEVESLQASHADRMKITKAGHDAEFELAKAVHVARMVVFAPKV